MIGQRWISLDADSVIVINGQALWFNSWKPLRVFSASLIRNYIIVVLLAWSSGSWESSRSHFEALRTVLIWISCSVEGNGLDVSDRAEAPLLTFNWDDLPVVRYCPLEEEYATHEDGHLACWCAEQTATLDSPWLLKELFVSHQIIFPSLNIFNIRFQLNCQ